MCGTAYFTLKTPAHRNSGMKFFPGLKIYKQYSMLLIPSVFLFALGGIGIMVTNLQIANIVPKVRSTILTVYNGIFDASAAVFLVCKFIYDNGGTVQTSFLILAGMSSCVVLTSIFMMPKKHVPLPLPNDYVIPLAKFCNKSKLEAQISDRTASVPPTTEDRTDPKRPYEVEESGKDELFELPHTCSTVSFKPDKVWQKTSSSLKYFCSPIWLWNLLWMTLFQFRMVSYVGNHNAFIGWLSDGDQKKVSQFANTLSLMQFSGVILSPVIGILLDRVHASKLRSSGFNDASSKERGHKFARLFTLDTCVPVLYLVITLTCLISVFTSIPVLELQYMSSTIHVIARALGYSLNVVVIANAFPNEHFGKLYTMTICIGSLPLLLQNIVFRLIEGPLNGNPLYINLVLLGLSVTAFGHPIYLQLHCRKKVKQVKDLTLAVSP